MNTDGSGIVREDGEEFTFDERGLGGKDMRQNIAVGLKVEFQLYESRRTNPSRRVAVNIRHSAAARARRKGFRGASQTLTSGFSPEDGPRPNKTAVCLKAPKRKVEAPHKTQSFAVPRGVERLAGPKETVETFLGVLEILDDKRLDGLIEVRRTNKDVLLVSRNIIEPKNETVSEVKITQGEEKKRMSSNTQKAVENALDCKAIRTAVLTQLRAWHEQQRDFVRQFEQKYWGLTPEKVLDAVKAANPNDPVCLRWDAQQKAFAFFEAAAMKFFPDLAEEVRAEQSKFATKAVFDIETGRKLSDEGFQYDGPVAKACGASSAMKNAANMEQGVAQQMNNDFGTVFSQNQSILSSLTSALTPIVTAGPNQQGFSPAEEAAMRTQSMDSTAAAGQQASNAVREEEASEGGGNTLLPSGVNEAINAGIAENTAQTNASKQLGITQADYAQGRSNFFNAEGALTSAPGALENPATQSGEAAMGGAEGLMGGETQINQANTAWEGALGGLIGQLGGAAITAFAPTPKPPTPPTPNYGPSPDQPGWPG